MPPAAKKDVALLLFDMKSSNKDKLLEGLIKLVTQKMVSTNDFCHLLLDEDNVTLCTAKKIIQEIERSVLCNLKIGVNIALYFREHQGSQAMLVPISIGNNLHIPAKTLKIFNRKSNLKLTHKNFNYLATIFEEDEQIEICSEEMIKTERCFKIVGFTNNKYVHEAYVKGDSTFAVLPCSILPYDGKYQLFFTLVKVLSKNNKSAIVVERIHNKNYIHKYFVLEPVLDVNGPHFVMTTLPYADDVSEKFTLSVISMESFPVEVEGDFDRFCRSIEVPLGQDSTEDF